MMDSHVEGSGTATWTDDGSPGGCIMGRQVGRSGRRYWAKMGAHIWTAT